MQSRVHIELAPLLPPAPQDLIEDGYELEDVSLDAGVPSPIQSQSHRELLLLSDAREGAVLQIAPGSGG